MHIGLIESILQQFPKAKYAQHKTTNQKRPFNMNKSLAKKKTLNKKTTSVLQHSLILETQVHMKSVSPLWLSLLNCCYYIPYY